MLENNIIIDEVSAAYKEMMSQPEWNACSIGAPIPIPIIKKEHLISLCDQATDILKNQPTVLHLDGPFTIVGDVHGNFHDLIRIFSRCGHPSQTNYLFLGDYVDRGQYSIETMTLLFLCLIQYPDKVHLLRGNHEFPEVNSLYGFKEEVEAAYEDLSIWEKMNDVFEHLPIVAILNQKILCVHGGLSNGFSHIQQIENVKKPLNSNNIPSLVKKILWSDPSCMSQFYGEGERGFGETFGPLALYHFFETSGMSMLIRAHQCVREGTSIFKKKCITVFSSSGYNQGNCGATLMVQSSDAITSFQFEPISVPQRNKAIFFNMTILPKLAKANTSQPIAMIPLKKLALTPGASNTLKKVNYCRSWRKKPSDFTIPKFSNTSRIHFG